MSSKEQEVDIKLYGYERSDRKVGFRNHVLVMALSGCTSDIVRRISDKVPGTTYFAHPNGCDLQYGDADLQGKILEHTALHPNVGGVIFVTMGCAATLSLNLPAKIKKSGRLYATANIHNGTSQAVAQGIEVAQEMVQQLSKINRTEVPVSALTVGTKCGASDANSFRYCHPVVGTVCDRLIAKGATVVLSEDCELVGAAELLADRAINKKVAASICRMKENCDNGWTARFGCSRTEELLKIKSKDAMIEQSLANAAKAGTTPITGLFDMAEQVSGPGLVILDAPNTDLENMTCLAAAGCNIVLFTTGRGTPVGSPTAITVKITATEASWIKMQENIDQCVADVIDNEGECDAIANRVIASLVKYLNGEPTKAEKLRHFEVAIPIRGVTY